MATSHSLEKVLGWIGDQVHDVYGAGVGTVVDVLGNAEAGAPEWLLVKTGRFSSRRHVLVPIAEAAEGARHIWVPYEKNLIRNSPPVEADGRIEPGTLAAVQRHYGLPAISVAEEPETRPHLDEVAEEAAETSTDDHVVGEARLLAS